MAGSQKYLVLFVAAAIVSSLVIVWIALVPKLDPLAIPPGETRGLISVCFVYSGASAATYRVTIDGVERGNISLGRRSTGCVYPLVVPGTHVVSVYCYAQGGGGGSRTWSETVDLSSREVVQLPRAGQSYSCQ